MNFMEQQLPYGARYSMDGSYGGQPNQTIQNLLANPAVQSALFSGGGGALGSALGGPLGGALGAGGAPIVQSLLTHQQAPWNQVLTQAAIAALGGGVGSTLGPIGGGLGGAAGGYFGQQIAQRPGGIGSLFGRPASTVDGAYNGESMANAPQAIIFYNRESGVIFVNGNGR